MKVSVIIPTYNRAGLVRRAINSALNQTLKDLEIIVVDDGSVDDTKKVVESFNNDKIKYIYQENSGGAAKPKNTGIKASGGEYIAVLDSDDEWLEKKLEKQIKYFENSKNPKLGAVGCNIFVVEKGKTSKYRMPKHEDLFKRMLVTDDMGTGSCMAYKREVFNVMGMFDENLKSGQDREFRIRLFQKYDFAFVDEYLVNYYVGSDSISTPFLDIRKREKDWQYIFKKYKKYYETDSKLYSDKLRYDGTRYMLLGEKNKAQKSFLFSILKNPLNVKSFLYLFFSLFGTVLYNKSSKIKLWLKQLF